MATELTCTESEELLALGALGVLTADDGAMLDAHLRRCDACRSAGRTLERTAAMLPESLDLLDPPASLRRRLLAEVYGAAPRRDHRRWWAAAWSRVPQGRPLTVVAAAATAAAVGLGVWGANRGGTSPARTFPVVGTTTEPSASGTLTYYPGSAQSVVTLTGLPAPTTSGGPPDVYELWLIPRDGTPRAAGLLTESPLTHTWSGAVQGDLAQFVTMAATREPAGGSTRPTGPQLFSVQLTQ